MKEYRDLLRGAAKVTPIALAILSLFALGVIQRAEAANPSKGFYWSGISGSTSEWNN